MSRKQGTVSNVFLLFYMEPAFIETFLAFHLYCSMVLQLSVDNRHYHLHLIMPQSLTEQGAIGYAFKVHDVELIMRLVTGDDSTCLLTWGPLLPSCIQPGH